jgi:hypothetical protein
MAHVTRNSMIGIAVLLAIVTPCSSEPPFAVQVQNNSGSVRVAAQSGAPLRPLMALTVEQTPAPTFPVDQPGTVDSLAEVGATAEDGPEGLDKKVACAMEKVIPATSKQVREFVANVNRISATEELQHERMNKEGTVIEQKHHKFNYVAEFQEAKPGMLSMDEYRDGSVGQSGFPGEVSTVGITSLVLIFHPYHVKEFDMTCDGTELWQGRAVWKVRFAQRMDKPARMSALRVGDAVYPILLKGTAWIDEQNYQIVHLETDILRPVPEVRLTNERQVLDYGPVQFEQKKLKLWLPLEAEIYLDVNGKRFHHHMCTAITGCFLWI